MTWEPPTFEEIKMDAEFTAYCEDVDEDAAGPGDLDPPCDSTS
jgi:hypothetical protein